MHLRILALLVLFAGALHLAAAVPTDTNKIVSIFVGLKQQNIDRLHEIALSVSDPDSPLYGKYLSKNEVLELVAPPKEDHDLVVTYFRNLGFSVQSFGDSLILQAPVKTIERALQTPMDTLIAVKHSDGSSLHRTFPTTPYKIAEHIMDKIEIITTNTGESNIKRLADYQPKSKRSAEQQSLPNVVPLSVRSGYNISGPLSTATNPKTTQLVVEFNHETMPQDSDIQQFVQATKEQYSNWTQIYGGYGPVGVGDVRESSLDFEYIMTVGRGAQNWWMYIKGWMMEFAVALNAMQTTPLVASISWGWAESDQCNIMETGTDCKGYDTYTYINRVNNEFAKLAARGVSLLAGSGDTGAAGPLNPNCETSIPPLYPMFPASSPWVTSVGAVTWTGNRPNTPPLDEFDALFYSTKKRQIIPPPLCNAFPQTQCAFGPQIEVVSTAGNTFLQFTSGGGFSDKTPQPSYQTAAVASYLKIPGGDVMMPPPGSFNPKNRAYPDIAAVGARLLTIIMDFPTIEEGTSASTPIFGAMVSLLNDARLNKNKAPLGFLVSTNIHFTLGINLFL
jgi:tripeptidyl-peptidase-1